MIGAGQLFAPVSAVNLERYEVAAHTVCIIQQSIAMRVPEGFTVHGLLVINGILKVES